MNTALSRARELLSGRHRVRLHLVPTVTGRWAWSSTCHTCTGLTHAGIEPTRAAALAAAHRLVGDRDDHLLDGAKRLNNQAIGDQLLAAGEHALRRWDDMYSLVQRSAEGRGTLSIDAPDFTMRLGVPESEAGYTAAIGGVHDNLTDIVTWAYLTDAGWCGTSTDDVFDAPLSAEAAELAAAHRVLSIYPTASAVTLLIDNRAVAELIEDLQELTRVNHRFTELPIATAWASQEHTQGIKDLLQSRRVTVQRVHNGAHPLHFMADTLASQANVCAAKNLDWQPSIDPLRAHAQPVNAGCGPCGT